MLREVFRLRALNIEHIKTEWSIYPDGQRMKKKDMASIIANKVACNLNDHICDGMSNFRIPV